MSKIPKSFLDKLKGKNVDTGQIEKIASGVKKSDLADDHKLRQLVRQLSAIAHVSLSKEKEDKIVDYVRKNNVQATDFQSISKLLKGKK